MTAGHINPLLHMRVLFPPLVNVPPQGDESLFLKDVLRLEIAQEIILYLGSTKLYSNADAENARPLWHGYLIDLLKVT